MGKTKRKSGIELLRIIIMLQIIVLHLYGYGGFTDYINEIGGMTNHFFNMVWVVSRMPVDVFMIISGYFMVTSEFNLKKVFGKGKTIYLTMIFYSVVISGIFFAVNPDLISVRSVVKALMPFFSKRWYFLSNYLIVLALSPFVNMILQKLSKMQYLIFAGIVFVVMSVWPTISNIKVLSKIFQVTKIVDPYMGKSVGGFLLMYIIGGYLRRFTTENNKPQYRYLILFFTFCAMDFLIHGFPQYGSAVFGMYTNPLVIFEAISIFLFFRDINFSSSFVNTIAGTTLGIYAIHETPYIRKLIWQNNFYDGTFMNLPELQSYVAAFAYCVGIFVVCCLLDLLRQKLFEGVGYLYHKVKSNE